MIALRIEVPYATFRKSFARGYAESYPLPPPATVYGMLLSLVGERFRRVHEGVRLAFAYKGMPRVATTLRKLSRFKYGVASKQSELGNQPDYIETLCDLDFVCWLDSSTEQPVGVSLEDRVVEAIRSPHKVGRYGILCLGLSDDAVDSVALCEEIEDRWLRLIPENSGNLELPIWVDHVGSMSTKWKRYRLDAAAVSVRDGPCDEWGWTAITAN